MGVSQSTVLKIRATVLKDPESAVSDPESAATDPELPGLSDIDQDVSETAENDLPLASTKYEKWRSQYVRPWKDMFYIDYNKRKEVKEDNAVTCSEGKVLAQLLVVTVSPPLLVRSWADIFISCRSISNWIWNVDIGVDAKPEGF